MESSPLFGNDAGLVKPSAGMSVVLESLDPENPKRFVQQARINEKYRYVAELRYEIEQARIQINALVTQSS
jgi:hypothetical protein